MKECGNGNARNIFVKKILVAILPLDTAGVICVRRPLAHASFHQFGFTYMQWNIQAYMAPIMAATHSMRGFPFSPIDGAKRTTLYMASSKDSNCLPISGSIQFNSTQYPTVSKLMPYGKG